MTETKELVPTMSFEERLKKKVQDDIGNLLTDEDLKAIIARSLHDAIYAQREKLDRWGNKEKMGPPLIHEIITSEFRPMLEAEAKKFFKENHETIMASVSEKINQDLMKMTFDLISSLITSKLNYEMSNIQESIRSQIQTY